jgi:hypothetical protein
VAALLFDARVLLALAAFTAVTAVAAAAMASTGNPHYFRTFWARWVCWFAPGIVPLLWVWVRIAEHYRH